MKSTNPSAERAASASARWIARLAVLVTAAVLSGGVLLSPAQAQSARESGTAAPAPARLTNLAHLDFLSDSVAVPRTAAHSTYGLTADPRVGVLWVYAHGNPDGTFDQVGGGLYNSGANTYGQGAYDADDMARAAVVYLRQWKATGSGQARRSAYQLLRGLTYLQTLTGPTAGEVVLWMQPNGALNPTPTPADSPSPSDSGPSYWLARTLWADGEGYAAFLHTDPAFAAFLKARMDLAVAALHRDVLRTYGQYRILHGVRVPAWLIVDGADASSEAILGLAAYDRTSGGTAAAHRALVELGRGVAEMSAGTTTSWPYRALMPWALSRSDWHAWGAQMASGLAAAAAALHRPDLLAPAVGDTAGFTAQLLTSTGPDNGLLPTPVDRSQIAYGADARVQSLLSVGVVAHRPGIRSLAGIAAGWFFGANASGAPVYDPSTGVTRDGVSDVGRVNLDSGAESTIHGLLTMQVLDANPDLAALARASATVHLRDGLSVVEAETGSRHGNAVVAKPVPPWTGESQWSGSYVAAGPGSTVSWRLPSSAAGPRLVQPVAELLAGATATTRFTADGRLLGVVDFGAVGPQGGAPSVGELIPVNLPGRVPAGPVTLTARTAGGTGNIDALMVMPVVAALSASGGSRAVGLLTSKSSSWERRRVPLTGTVRLEISTYDRNGALVCAESRSGATDFAAVAPGGFTIVTRGLR